MVIEACLAGTLKMLFLAVTTMRNQQGVVQSRQQTQAPGDLVPVHLRQADIEQDNVGAELDGTAQGGGAIPRGLHHVTINT